MKTRRNMTEAETIAEYHHGAGEHEMADILLGSGLSPSHREILREANAAFGGGYVFTRKQFIDNTTPSKRSVAGRALSAMIARKIVREREDGRLELTKHGEEVAYGDSLISAETYGESALASAIEGLESDDYRPREPRGRTLVEPHAAKGKRACKLCKLRHSLKAHRSHRVDAPRVKCSLIGCVEAEDPSFDFGALARNPTPFGKLPKRQRRALRRLAAKAAAILGVPVRRVAFARMRTPKGCAKRSVFVAPRLR
jgi:hypothetical protein